MLKNLFLKIKYYQYYKTKINTKFNNITILKAHKFKFKEKLFSKKALLDADEVFMTSATNFIMPIIKVDSYKISNGKG